MDHLPHVAGDFAGVVDAAQPIAIERAGLPDIAIGLAWCRAHRVAPVTGSGGGVLAIDAQWHCEWPAGETAPQPGDTVIDAAGSRHAVLAVEQGGARSRLRLATRRFAWRAELQVVVSLREATNAALTAWTTIATGIVARLQPVVTESDFTPSASSSTTIRAWLDDARPLDHRHRVQLASGGEYRVVRFHAATNLGELPVVELEPIA